jgi:hypothetical protein
MCKKVNGTCSSGTCNVGKATVVVFMNPGSGLPECALLVPCVRLYRVNVNNTFFTLIAQRLLCLIVTVEMFLLD